MAEGAGYRIKASVFRAHLKVLERDGKLAAMLARLSPATARLVKTPPLGSSWMESPPSDELVEHVETLEGLDGVRYLAKATLALEMSPMLSPMVRGIVRIIGGRPPTLYARMGDLVRTVMQDVEYQWTSSSDHSGTQQIRYPKGRNVPLRTFVSAMAGLEHMLTLCSVVGVVDDPLRRGDNAADFAIRWTPR